MPTIQEIKKNIYNKIIEIYDDDESKTLVNICLQEVLKMNTSQLLLNQNTEISSQSLQQITQIVSRLLTSEPIQYILGKTMFLDLEFELTNATLIPRPETEEMVLMIINEHKHHPNLSILDLCTGSGVIAITLQKYLPNATVDALELSNEALKIAHINNQKHATKINFIHQDIFQYSSNIKYDIIVSNPPYVRECEKIQMNNNVLTYEPPMALFVNNENPLLFYKQIASIAKNNLNDNGTLYLEINQYLAEETQRVIKNANFSRAEIKQDVKKNNRFLKAKLF